jgi:DNA-binding MarR family transcriptional regulator
MAFDEADIIAIITKQKQKNQQKKYIKGYNSCDGENNVTQISSECGLDSGNLSRILKSWEDIGILWSKESKDGKIYKKLFHVSDKLKE